MGTIVDRPRIPEAYVDDIVYGICKRLFATILSAFVQLVCFAIFIYGLYCIGKKPIPFF